VRQLELPGVVFGVAITGAPQGDLCIEAAGVIPCTAPPEEPRAVPSFSSSHGRPSFLHDSSRTGLGKGAFACSVQGTSSPRKGPWKPSEKSAGEVFFPSTQNLVCNTEHMAQHYALGSRQLAVPCCKADHRRDLPTLSSIISSPKDCLMKILSQVVVCQPTGFHSHGDPSQRCSFQYPNLRQGSGPVQPCASGQKGREAWGPQC